MRRLKVPCVSLAVTVLWMIMAGYGCTGFNLDITMPITRTGPADSLFGYAVALHRQGVDENVLLVGAPRAQTSQPDVVNGGAVYRCPVLTDDCEQVIFDSEGQRMTDQGYQIGNKSGQFFGATVHSSGPGGPVVACAPRRVWSEDRYYFDNSSRYLTGVCFVASNDLNTFTAIAPCEDRTQLGLKKISYCLAGISATITQDARLLMGTPGSYYGQGQIYDFDIINGQAEALSNTSEKVGTFDDNYQGYTVAQGTFGTSGVYVIGEPRANFFIGKVRIMDGNLNILLTIDGEQISAYFGHSLAVTDVNNDGLDDIVIGAPMFVDPDNLMDKWEVGRAYVYCQEAAGTFRKTDYMTGTYAGGQFGFSVAALGDVNRDGYNDIAIGAPFAGEDGQGVVYVYLGRQKGVKQAPSQIIRPADLGLNIKAFGSSLSGGLDVDNNNYSDFLVGAYMSSTAVLLRSRPIIRIQKSLTFEPPQLNLDTKDYQLPSGLKVSSFNVTTCLTAKGHNIPGFVDVKYSLQLDAVIGTTSRAAFVQDDSLDKSELTRTIKLATNEETCQKDLVYVKVVITEKNLPIAVRLVYELAPEKPSMSTVTPPAMSEVPPILSDTPPPVYAQSLPIKNTCKNYLCVPDLLLTATTDTKRVAVGDNSEVVIRVSVTNNGEDAYQASFQATIPEGMDFIRVERTTSDLTVTCSTLSEDSAVVTCDIGNPLPEEYTLDFGITIINSQLTGDKEKVIIGMEVDSKNYEPANITHDNTANVTLEVYASAELGLYGVSSPQQIVYLRSNGSMQTPDPETEQEAGPEVTHLYMLRNLGPSEIGRVEVLIYWPLTDSDKDYLLYLISVTLGTGERCQVQGGVNPDDLELEQKEDNTNSSDPSDMLPSGLKVRRRRESDKSSREAMPQVDTRINIECNEPSDACVLITCIVDAPSRTGEDQDSALIEIRSRMYEQTFLKKNYQHVFISSTAFATVLEMPYMASIVPANLSTATAQATIQVIGQSPTRPITPTEIVLIPFWVYILAPIGGAIILLIVGLGLWKCGFFKRKKIVPNNPQAAAQENWQEELIIDDKE